MQNTIDQDYTYKIGHITFIVTPVYKSVHGETISEILLKMMKADVTRDKIA